MGEGAGGRCYAKQVTGDVDSVASVIVTVKDGSLFLLIIILSLVVV